MTDFANSNPSGRRTRRFGLRTINAKAETITTAPAFREPIKYRRCLVPADAFYEWQHLYAKTKQPFAIAMKDGQPYALAGLWEKWKDRKAGGDLLTFTIITTDPNEVVQPMHDRMPAIISGRDYDRWLRADPDRPPIDLLRPYDADKMTAWKVDKAVGNGKSDSRELIEPASAMPEKDEQGLCLPLNSFASRGTGHHSYRSYRTRAGSHLKSRNQPSLDSFGELYFSPYANVFLSFSPNEGKEDQVPKGHETYDEPRVQVMTALQLDHYSAGRHFPRIEWQYLSEIEYGQEVNGDGEREKTNEPSTG